MISLKFFATLICFICLAQVRAVYITWPSSLTATQVSVNLAKPGKLSVTTSRPVINPRRSLLVASTVDAEPVELMTNAPVEAPMLMPVEAASNLTADTSHLPARDGLIQYVPEPNSLFVVAAGAWLAGFRRRRSSR
jgi:hypothetical protein